MQRCMEAGMKPAEFWDAGFNDTLLVMQGYNSRVNVRWQQARLIAYTTYLTVTKKEDRVNIYDFWPLAGDPTDEELQQAENEKAEEVKEAQRLAAIRQKAFNDELRKELASKK